MRRRECLADFASQVFGGRKLVGVLPEASASAGGGVFRTGAGGWAAGASSPTADADGLADRFTALLLDGMRGYVSR